MTTGSSRYDVYLKNPITKDYLRANVTVDLVTGCWLWNRQVDGRGYGVISRIINGKQAHFAAHRWSYRIFKGPLNDGLEIDHLCRVKRCVNPDHLEQVTHVVNIMRGLGFAAQNAAKDRCAKGHEYNDENTRIVISKTQHKGRGPRQRVCITCSRAWTRECMARKRREQREAR